ncbi:MAG: NFACT RNA binding domain-containing protein [Sphaerochaetaceae bacterium]
MSLNWKEIEQVLSELPLVGSSIQKTYQIGFHGLLMELFHHDQGRWNLYVEVGTIESRIHRVVATFNQLKPKKTTKLQRFIQFLRANVEHGVITGVEQLGKDRLVRLDIRRYDEQLQLFFRLYSGPGANIIVCTGESIILELLFRRPNRDEIAGKPLSIPTDTKLASGSRQYHIRDREEALTFNEQLEREYGNTYPKEDLDQLLLRVRSKRDAEISQAMNTVQTLRQRMALANSFMSYKETADLLASFRHLITDGAKWITVPNWNSSDGSTIEIELDPKLDASGNIDTYYKKYQKAKGRYENLCNELSLAESNVNAIVDRYAQILDSDPIDSEAIKKLLGDIEGAPAEQKNQFASAPGLQFKSGLFTLLVGRNAKENDELLRRWVKGNDWWMHTRDVPGGYVFIKSIPSKSVPLETLLDAATLALVYSKAKDAGKADLYYTQAKYLRRAKGAKIGTVLPTQEKNFSIVLDESRLKRLFSNNEDPTAPT